MQIVVSELLSRPQRYEDYCETLQLMAGNRHYLTFCKNTLRASCVREAVHYSLYIYSPTFTTSDMSQLRRISTIRSSSNEMQPPV